MAEAVGCGTALVQVPQGNSSAFRRSHLSLAEEGPETATTSGQMSEFCN